MHKQGRHNKIPARTAYEIIRLYCQRDPHDETYESFMYSPEEIARAVGVDPKSARLIIRQVGAHLMEKHWIRKQKPYKSA